jgi:hypothetical protein
MILNIVFYQDIQTPIGSNPNWFTNPYYELPLFSKALAAYTKYDGIISIGFLISLLLRDTVKNNNQINEIF